MKLVQIKPEAECKKAIEERLQVLRDTFGENDARVRKVEGRVDEMTELDAPANWHIAAMYTAWATKNPSEITREPVYDCTCADGKGWVIETDESGRISSLRPCSRCNQEIFQYVYEKGGLKVTAGQGDNEPPPREPHWDDL